LDVVKIAQTVVYRSLYLMADAPSTNHTVAVERYAVLQYKIFIVA